MGITIKTGFSAVTIVNSTSIIAATGIYAFSIYTFLIGIAYLVASTTVMDILLGINTYGSEWRTAVFCIIQTLIGTLNFVVVVCVDGAIENICIAVVMVGAISIAGAATLDIKQGHTLIFIVYVATLFILRFT